MTLKIARARVLLSEAHHGSSFDPENPEFKAMLKDGLVEVAERAGNGVKARLTDHGEFILGSDPHAK
jgi:hypothetical protein